MSIVDIIALVLIIIGAISGFRKGAIKQIISLVGFVAIVIVAYQFKGLLGNYLIRIMPFFNFGGILKDLYAMNILFYEGISFVVIFILLYCILNILINISGIFDLIVKFTIIFELPSKILGAVFGAIDALVLVFVLAFLGLQFNYTQKYVNESDFAISVVEKMPVLNVVFGKTSVASREVYRVINEHQEDEDKTEANLEIVRILIRYDIVDAQTVQQAINDGKLNLENVVVAS